MWRRTLESSLRSAMRTFPAVVLTGARQAGKTTLLREALGASHRYVSLDDPDLRARAQADPVGFLTEHPPPVVIDEIQNVPAILPYIKRRIDEDRRPGGWILTGSQAFSLMVGVTESLAGRAAILSLLPFSVAEACGAPADDEDVDSLLHRTFRAATPEEADLSGTPALSDWILRGGWPEPRSNPEVDRKLWCSSYIQTYLERDLRALAHVGDLASFERFLRLCAARTGQLLNLSDLARDTGVSQSTAARWLSVLEASGQVFLLQPLHGNYAKRLVKSPKLYFTDTALATFLVGLHDPSPTMLGPMAGALVETVVVVEWLKAFRHRGEPPSMSFFRTGDGLEVDLVIERNGKLFAAEVKATSTVLPRHAAALRTFTHRTGAAGPAVIFADVDRATAVAPGVVVRPWCALGLSTPPAG